MAVAWTSARTGGGERERLTGTSKKQHVDLFQKINAERVDLREEAEQGDGREAVQARCGEHTGLASACGAVPGPCTPQPPRNHRGCPRPPGGQSVGGTGDCPWKGPRRGWAGPERDPMVAARASSDCGSEGSTVDRGGDGNAAPKGAGRQVGALFPRWGPDGGARELFTPRACPCTHVSCYESFTL